MLLVGLLADFGQHRQRIVPVEANLAGLGLQLERAGKGGQGDRDAGEGARSFLSRALACLLRALLALDALPQVLDGLGGETARFPEHMRMAADKLLGDRLDHVAEIEGALLLRHAGVEHDLQQEVAQFVAQIVEIAAGDGVGDLVGLLDRVGRDGREILLQIPRTAGPGRAQRRHDVEKTGDIAGRGHWAADEG